MHPRAILRSLGGGALVLGANNIVEECAEIVNRLGPSSRSRAPLVRAPAAPR